MKRQVLAWSIALLCGAALSYAQQSVSVTRSSSVSGANADTCTGNNCQIGSPGFVTDAGISLGVNASWHLSPNGNDLVILQGTTNYATWSFATGTLTAAYGLNAFGGNGFDTGPAVGYKLNGYFLFQPAAPTIVSGFGTSPSIVATNSSTFRVNVGTGGTASSGVIGMPTSNGISAGWGCMCTDLSTPGINVTKQNGVGTSTQVTITNYVSSTGIATAWTASDVIQCNCMEN